VVLVEKMNLYEKGFETILVRSALVPYALCPAQFAHALHIA